MLPLLGNSVQDTGRAVVGSVPLPHLPHALVHPQRLPQLPILLERMHQCTERRCVGAHPASR